MRLLDVNSVAKNRLPVFRDLHENGPSSPLCYAILSHTWGQRQDYKDIVFDDIPSSETFARFLPKKNKLKQWQAAIRKKQVGFSKIANACRIAREMGMSYIWIDSCCIDKSKSAELNESINSMYRWYQNAERCIVYLEDLQPDSDLKYDLKKCRWFERGWTLQELIAPSKVTFYNKSWASLGDRSDASLSELLSNITGIDMGCLQSGENLRSFSNAHKMSWAAGRKTTVPEDRAYSLMGIFDVNMPLIYGEGGPKAFRRLQEEITRLSSDLSIFAWNPSSEADTELDAFGSSPDDFTAHKDIVPCYSSQHFMRTNKGMEMKTSLWRVRCDDMKERLMLVIGKEKNGKLGIGIILRKVGHNMCVRRGKMLLFLDDKITSFTRTSTFYLISPHMDPTYDQVLDMSRERAILIPEDGLGGFHINNPVPEYTWDCEDRLFLDNGHWGGSDWRAIELVNAGLEAKCKLRLIALFVLKDGAPDCYLLRWTEKLSFIFDRKHQTEITRLEDFRHILEGATNEVEIEGSGTEIEGSGAEILLDGRGPRLSIRLIATTADKRCREQFRMDIEAADRNECLSTLGKSMPRDPSPPSPFIFFNDDSDSERMICGHIACATGSQFWGYDREGANL